eukprot:364185-Chlamydomonas_euryale.AAC.11
MLWLTWWLRPCGMKALTVRKSVRGVRSVECEGGVTVMAKVMVTALRHQDAASVEECEGCERCGV